jgi:putative salt-induced outer membrane protein YdiY
MKEMIVAKQRLYLAALGAAAALLLTGSPAFSDGGAENMGLLGPWKATAEVSYVVTGGNTASSAFSLGTSVTRKWANDTLYLKTFMLRSNSVTTTRTAQGSSTDFEVIEDRVERLVAENYLLSGQYERRVSNKLLAQAGLSWDRNRFAGVASRVIFTSGVGYAWAEGKKTQIKTDANLTYTMRKYVGQDATSFTGLRFNLLGVRKILENSSLSTQFIFDEDLKKTKDWRFDWTSSATASISRFLALKTSLRMLYSHVPAMQDLALYNLEGRPTGLTVPAPLKELDTFLTTSIVFAF